MRPETIEDILVTLHEGQWFGFNGDKVYANLWVADGYDKPTEEELNTTLENNSFYEGSLDFDSNQELDEDTLSYGKLKENNFEIIKVKDLSQKFKDELMFGKYKNNIE